MEPRCRGPRCGVGAHGDGLRPRSGAPELGRWGSCTRQSKAQTLLRAPGSQPKPISRLTQCLAT
eukprot:12839455-Alexandrium_andersonii.AAC.1